MYAYRKPILHRDARRHWHVPLSAQVRYPQPRTVSPVRFFVPRMGGIRYTGAMAVSPLRIGYARVSTDSQDLSAQRDALASLGVSSDRVYVDHGMTGTNRDRPGLRQALAACRSGDTLVVAKLDRLARSIPDARAIADELTARGIKLSLGGSIHDPNDAMGRMFFNILATFAEFEVDLLRMRTREGMAIARAKGRLRGKQPKLTPRQETHLVELHDGGGHTVAELGELFGVARSTVYRALGRAQKVAALTLQ